MPIVFACSCGQTFRVKDDRAGKAFGCPSCKARLEVPGILVSGIGIETSAPSASAGSSSTPMAGSSWLAAWWYGRRYVAGLSFFLGAFAGFLINEYCFRTSIEKLISANSPEYMLAVADLQRPIPLNHDRVGFYRALLFLARDYYKDEARIIAYEVADNVASLNLDGFSSDAFAVLYGSVECAKKSKLREGLQWEKIDYRSFMSIYDFFRRTEKLSHNDALKQIVDMEKL